MPSGGKELQINAQERAVSSDVNRVQSFANHDRAEIMRALMSTSFLWDDWTGGGTDSEVDAVANPLAADIVRGGGVIPHNGTLDLLVQPCVMHVVDPANAAATVDDSHYQAVLDPGIASLGVLMMTANVTAFGRCDVIECQETSAVVETDNRDIFNPITGLFTVTTVTKARANQLTYRVRAGTPGAGFPGTVVGWLPLAVAFVPTLAATNDAMTFWDVRPLAVDRVRQPFNVGLNVPRIFRNEGRVLRNGASAVLTSVVECTSADDITGYPVGYAEQAGRGLYRLGGVMRAGTPDGGVALTNGLTISDVRNQESGGLPAAAGLYYVYLVQPFGLPRWARYLNAVDGVRTGRSPRGIPIASARVQPDARGAPSSTSGALVLPATVFGVATNVTDGMCVHAGWTDAGGIPLDTMMATDGAILASTALGLQIPHTAPTPVYNAGTFTTTWTLMSGVDYPTSAKEILVVLGAKLVVPAATAAYWGTLATAEQVLVSDVYGLGTVTVEYNATIGQYYNGAGAPYWAQMATGVLRVPIPFDADAGGGLVSQPGTTCNIQWILPVGGVATPVAANFALTVLGWKL